MKNIQSIGTKLFSESLRNGVYAVINAQEELNSINVFPVADGDTGTNLCLSLYPLINFTKDNKCDDICELLEGIADKLLDHSRGNSGSIMAQFFQGMSDGVNDAKEFSPEAFSDAVNTGSTYAREALINPVEGTILTVIANFAESFKDICDKNKTGNFSDIFPKALDETKLALTNTKNQLAVLRNSNVEDAGAMGFFLLMQGFIEYLVYENTQKEPAPDSDVNQQIVESHHDNDEVDFQYCTECIIAGDDIDKRKLKESLLSWGNSIVIAGTKRKTKIHIHTDEPRSVFKIAKEFGSVSSEKADDMKKQSKMTSDQSRNFAVITDSAADISEEDIENLDIHIVPIRIQFGSKSYLDKVNITPPEFFDEIIKNPIHPTTSQPSVGDFRRQFEYLASHHEDVISISVTGTISGTMQAAESAVKRIKSNGKIHIFNSLNASLGQGQIAVYAAKCSKEGKSIQNTLEELSKIRKNTKTFAYIPNLKYAVKGGRVPKSVKYVADFFGLTPVLVSTHDGLIATKHFLFGKKNLIRKFAKYIVKFANQGNKINISIGHAIAEEEALYLKKYLQSKVPNVSEFKVTELGTAIGVHGGPGAIVVGVQILS